MTREEERHLEKEMICIRCKSFIFKIMLNGYDGICEKHDCFTGFINYCDDFERGQNNIYER